MRLTMGDSDAFSLQGIRLALPMQLIMFFQSQKKQKCFVKWQSLSFLQDTVLPSFKSIFLKWLIR